MMILLTGVGARLLNQVIEMRYPGRFPDALRRLPVIARGPKPAAVLREWQVPIAAIAPEPNTWRELLAVVPECAGRRIAVQEYGKPSAELIEGLRARGAHVTCVRVYRWEMPEDTAPLRDACARLAAGAVDVAMFTTSIQIAHLLRTAAEMGIEAEVRSAFSRLVVASIGPTTSEALEEHGIRADFEPSHPKMGFLIQETAERAAELRKEKQ
jgi:uroporphyrinogen-III synthase